MSDGAKGWLTALLLFSGVVLAMGLSIVDGSTTSPRTLHCLRTLTVDTPEGQRAGSSVWMCSKSSAVRRRSWMRASG